jgi:methyl-accepting chemotaxis protein
MKTGQAVNRRNQAMADVQFDRRQLLTKAGAIGAALTALAFTQGPVSAFADDSSSDSDALAALVSGLKDALQCVQEVLEQRVETVEDLSTVLQKVLDLLVQLINELIASIENQPLGVKVKLSDLPDLLGVLQDGVSTLLETILGDIEDIQVGVIRIK